MRYFLSAIIAAAVLYGYTGAYASPKADHAAFAEMKECESCHPDALHAHRSRKIALTNTGLPLDKSHRMLCVTCHECVSDTCKLRKPGTALCATCHDCTQGMACLVNTAHIRRPEARERFSPDQCKGCHSGIEDLGMCNIGEAMTGRAYDIRTMKRQRQVVLVNGKVTCISCHDPYSTRNAKLITENIDNRLCLNCHRQPKKVKHLNSMRYTECLACHPTIGPSHKMQKPKAAVDSRLPLGKDGEMLCTTCHECITGTCSLRITKPALCQTCHDCTQGMSCLIGYAHGSNAPLANTLSNELCLGCHDSQITSRQCDFSNRRAAIEGKMRCTTCHNPYSIKHQRSVRDILIPEGSCTRKLNMPIGARKCSKCHPGGGGRR